MKYFEQTGKTIPEAFEDYQYENPEIYRYFSKYAFELIHSGMKKISAKLIIERVRWEIIMETKPDRFKINNVFTSYYARLFVQHNPEHKNKFEFRKIKNPVAIQKKIPMT